jgi:microfibrillar-associated protein 1
MQKYYHKGAFYQDDELMQRDVNMPTMEDKADRSVMPSILQKRMGTFGRKGNSKWTHLTAEDTTNFDPATRVNENIARKV